MNCKLMDLGIDKDNGVNRVMILHLHRGPWASTYRTEQIHIDK